MRAAMLVWGLCFLRNSPKAAHKNLTLMAQGVMDVVSEKPFSVMLSNFGHRAVHIPKHTVVGLAVPSPTHISTLGESAAEAAEAKEGGGLFNSNLSTAKDAAVEADENCTGKGGAEEATPPKAPLRADGPDKPEDTAAPEEDRNSWQEDVHLCAEYEEVRSQVLEVLSELKGMWTGRLENIGGTKHRVELKPGARPIYQAPFRAGPTAREKEMTEIDHMLREGVIQLASAEWASPVVSSLKRTVPCGSASITGSSTL